MIKLFRKIRYDLMEQNKTGKYLKYAIGEIVLVVLQYQKLSSFYVDIDTFKHVSRAVGFSNVIYSE